MSASACPRHKPPDPNKCALCASWAQLEIEKKRLHLIKQKLNLDKELLRAEKKNYRRSTQVSSSSQHHDNVRLDAKMKEMISSHQKEIDAWKERFKKEQEDNKIQVIEWKLKFEKQGGDLEDMRRQLVENQRSNKNVEEIQTENEDLKQVMEKIHTRYAQDMQRGLTETQQLQQELQEIKDQLAEKEKAWQEERSRLSQEAETLTKQNAAEVFDKETLEIELGHAREEKDGYASQIMELQDRCRSLEAGQPSGDAIAVEELTALREELEEIKSEKEVYASQVVELQQRYKALQGETGRGVAEEGQCANCEDLEEEVFELKLKLNKRQVEHQKEMKELEERLTNKEIVIETVGTAAAVSSDHFVSSKEMQELRKVEVEKRKIESKFLALEAKEHLVQKEKEALGQKLREAQNDTLELALDFERLEKEFKTLQQQPRFDPAEMDRLKDQMDGMEQTLDSYAVRQKEELKEWNDMIDDLVKKQRQIFDSTLPEIEGKVNSLTTQLDDLENQPPPQQVSADIPPSDEQIPRQTRRVSQRRPPLTKVDSRKNRHVTEFDFVSDKQSGKYTGFLNMQNLPEGHGILRVDNGDVYEGEWKNGERHGQGGK
jgi:hypothetical protein